MWWWFRRLDRAERRIDELTAKVRELDKRVLFLMNVITNKPVPPKEEDKKG